MAITIKKGSDPVEVPFTKTLIYSPPGLGKTTFAQTADNPLLLDFDKGIKRVQPQQRKDSVEISNWADVEELLKHEALQGYDCLIIDTAGKMLDVLTLDIITTAQPKTKLAWNGNLTQQGYGVLKNRFKTFLQRVEELKKHLIFVAHDKETSDGDSTFIRPDIQGASRDILMREMDLIGYMSISEGKVMISFDPSDRYYGKNSCMLPKLIECAKIPMSKITELYYANQDKIKIVQEQYLSLLETIKTIVAPTATPEQFAECGKKINSLSHLWDSKLVAKQIFFDHVKFCGYEFNVATKEFNKIDNTPLPLPE